jgi:hypothetical protein
MEISVMYSVFQIIFLQPLNPMRHLPIYILLDTSGSMRGEPIEAVKTGLRALLSSLSRDPYAVDLQTEK